MDEQRPNDRNHLIDFIAATVEAMRHEMVTKDEFRTEIAAVRGEMATKGELRRLEEKMDAGFTAVRGDVERVALRLDQVDRNQSLRTASVENGVSRLRSVVYLLVKDQPDLVRMLG